jgi:hypothetical protein
MTRKERSDHTENKALALLAISRGINRRNSIAREIGVSDRGTFDILKELEKEGLIEGLRPKGIIEHNTAPITYVLTDRIDLVFLTVWKVRFRNERDLVKELMMTETYKKKVSDAVLHYTYSLVKEISFDIKETKKSHIFQFKEPLSFGLPISPSDPDSDKKLRNEIIRSLFSLEIPASPHSEEKKMRREKFQDNDVLSALEKSGKGVDAVKKLVLSFPGSAKVFFERIHTLEDEMVKWVSNQLEKNLKKMGGAHDENPIAIMLDQMLLKADAGDSMIPREFLYMYILS